MLLGVEASSLQQLERRSPARRAPFRGLSGQRPHVICGSEIADDVVRRVVSQVLDQVEPRGPSRVEELVHETIYCEEQRLAALGAQDPRAAEDAAFVVALRHDLARADEQKLRELVAGIVARYVGEIGGRFDPRVYQLVTRVLPRALGAALHGDLDERVKIDGEVGALRALARVGTVVLAPNHVSNLDSVLVGWAIHRLGLPPFAYAAGLNLFTSAIVGFFMRNLGAYTVDRKKTDPLYKATLEEYSTVLLERGQHSLVFPGGTRSRSGALPGKLKLGLLGTAPVAYRRCAERGTPRPVFVVPCTLTYPLVLEASSLVLEFLRTEGGPHYLDLADEFERPRRWIDFIRGVLELDLVIHLRVGAALDVVGNHVDEQGASLDPHGRPTDLQRYFTADGALAADHARDAEYTRHVSTRLMEAYARDSFALPTSVLALVLLERLRLDQAQNDLFRLLRALGSDATVPWDVAVADVERACAEIERLAERGAIQMSHDLRAPAPVVVERALDTFARYHARPVVTRRGDRVVVSDANLLFYYRNWLEGRGLAGAPALLSEAGHPRRLR